MTLAIIAPITVSKHPNADRLQLGSVFGSQVVVGMDVKSGDVGIFFQEGLQLSDEYAKANDLVRRKDADGNAAGGFFEENRRVRCQKFRGTKSEGYWAPLDSLSFASGWERLKVGDRLESMGKTPICNKYVTPATAYARAGKGVSVSRRETQMFKAHFDTDQLRFNTRNIKAGNKVYVTLKMHGTSQRTGRVLEPVEQVWWKKWLKFKPKYEWTYLTGSRNVIMGRGTGTPYHSDEFRKKAADQFIGKLHKGETVFYEVVGYEGTGKPIMGIHTPKGDVVKEYGKEPFVYSYGCPEGKHEAYVYRITMTNEDGISFDLPWPAVQRRCLELEVSYVRQLDEFTANGHADDLMARIEQFVEGRDPIGMVHPREGVCVRVEGNGESKAQVFKHKSFTFGFLEGYIKEKADYVDMEESS